MAPIEHVWDALGRHVDNRPVKQTTQTITTINTLTDENKFETQFRFWDVTLWLKHRYPRFQNSVLRMSTSCGDTGKPDVFGMTFIRYSQLVGKSNNLLTSCTL
jgi:hypothetical protein